MHPAPSVIAFTTLSGLGFGFLFWLGITPPAVHGWHAFGLFFVAYAFAVGGLLFSTFHLGNPQRALRAFTQWRTSWLSREAWLSVVALVVLGLYAAVWIFLDTVIAPLGWIGAVLALATVYATSMIYAQLATVPRWNHWLTPAHMLSFSLAGGAILAMQFVPALVLLVLAGLIQVAHWMAGDKRFGERGHTMGTATGLGNRGAVRQLDPPHTGTNYLLTEMVYVVGRKHAAKLRSIAIALACLVPLLVLAAAGGGLAAMIVAALAFLLGTFVSRWLFFAEAEHVVGLYYGKR